MHEQCSSEWRKRQPGVECHHENNLSSLKTVARRPSQEKRYSIAGGGLGKQIWLTSSNLPQAIYLLSYSLSMPSVKAGAPFLASTDLFLTHVSKCSLRFVLKSLRGIQRSCRHVWKLASKLGVEETWCTRTNYLTTASFERSFPQTPVGNRCGKRNKTVSVFIQLIMTTSNSWTSLLTVLQVSSHCPYSLKRGKTWQSSTPSH